MTRLFASVAALLLSSVAVSSACTAVAAGPVQFRLDGNRSDGQIQANFTGGGDHNTNHWSSSFRPDQLAGLDLARLRSGGDHAVQFTMIRDAGRLDCAGTGGRSKASGSCNFTPSPAFNDFVVSKGMRRPSHGEGLSLMALNARRETVEALHAAGYPVPTVDDLLALTALGVDSAYISGLANVGYRPRDLEALVQFKALDITPAFIQGYVRHGYGNLDPDHLVQLKALDINADYIASFERIGYRNLSVDQLVQLKALGVTADYARAAQQGSSERLTPERLVELRAVGFSPR